MTLMERLKTIGQALTTTSEPEVIQLEEKATLGGFFEGATKRLSNEKTISGKLLQANQGWVYRNNDVIAKEVSKIDFELFKVNLKGGEEDYVEIDDHPILTALDQFNNSTTKADALYMTQSHKKLTGDAFWLIQSKGIPGSNYEVEAMYILEPDKVELVLGSPAEDGDVLVEGYKYKVTIDGKEIERTYTPDEIIHFKTPNPNNMFRGYGAVEAAADTIDLDNLTTDTTRKFFDNGAITNFVLSTDNKITQDQLKRLKNELKAAYGGSRKAFQTMILAGGLKPENISYTNKDLEFMSQLEWYRDKIMVIFGNSKASLGIIDDVNRASHESAIISWKRNSVKPDMEAIVDTLNEFFVPKFGDRLILGFADPVPEDRDALLAEVGTLITNNVITVNEARAKLGYDEMTGQDELKKPQNVDVPKFLRKMGIHKDKQEYKAIKETARKVASEYVKSKRKPVVKTEEPVYTQFTKEEVDAYWYKQIRIVETQEERFSNALTQYIGKIVDNALENLDSEINKSAQKDLLSEADLIVQAELDFRPILTEVAIAAGQQAYYLINQDDPYIGLNIRNTITDNIKKFAESMIETDRELMIDIITDGIKEGKSVPNIKREILNRFNGTDGIESYTKIQAERVTRTEVLRVSTQATLDAYEASGVVEGKQWLTARDGRVDADCAFFDGRIEYKLDGTFYDNTNDFMDGNPPLHPNCRCVLLPVLTSKSYTPVSSVERETMQKRIAELEDQTDKRTKEYKELKHQYTEVQADDKAYIKALEKHLGVTDEGEETPNASDEAE